MQFPQFSVHRYGVSSIRVKKQPWPVDTISAFEFEFYTEDHPGGSLVDGKFRSVRKGYYSLCRPGQRQQLIPPFQCYFLNIRTQDPELCDLLDHLPDTGEVWNLDGIITLIREMMAVPDRRSLEGRLRVESCVGRILALLAEQRLPSAREDHSTVAHRKTLLMIDQYIRDHLSEDLSLKRLAQLSNLDPTYFHKLFTNAYGKTPAQRTQDYRLLAAKLALAEGILSLEEIAAQCGFSSQAYFCNIFKRATGKTPLQYRKEQLSRY